MKTLFAGILGVIVLTILACNQSLEMTARDAIAANKGLIVQAQMEYASCKTDATPSACGIINRDVAAQNVAIDALEGYCGSAAFNAGTAPCQPHAQLQDKLVAALTDLSRTTSDVKGLVK